MGGPLDERATSASGDGKPGRGLAQPTRTAQFLMAGREVCCSNVSHVVVATASEMGGNFGNADTFDSLRPKPDRLAFGGGGRHFCLGASLARLELRVIFEEVLARPKDIKLAGDPELVPSNWAHGYAKMPITFTPGPKLGQ